MNFKTYETLTIEIKENIDKRRVFEHLYNDAKLDDEKNIIKQKLIFSMKRLPRFYNAKTYY